MSHYSASKHLYKLMEFSKLSLIPMRSLVSIYDGMISNNFNPISHTYFGKNLRAGFQLFERVTRNYKKLEFGIKKILVSDEEVKITQKAVISKPFCHLQHFKKDKNLHQPKLLIVAPMAGHHATLLKSTVESLLPWFDVYITDWIDASQVPLALGKFDMDDYIQYLMEFLKHLGEGANIMAVCQPTVPTLAAVSIMSQDNSKYVPKSMILIGGPVDARKNPTAINNFAKGKSIEWFEGHLITEVPANHPGHGRLVYPGFLQLAGFMSMNIEKHIESHIKLFHDLVSGNHDAVAKQENFYDEYFAVMDLPAEFYIETIEEVFLDFSLATGKLKFHGKKIDLSEITKTALLGIEGENDDIAGVGQTKASLKLCKNIPDDKKEYYLQEGVGHYGVFSGSKFTKFVAPVIRDFINKNC